VGEQVVSIFLASRFAEFRDLRSALNKKFAAGKTGGRTCKLLDFDSESSGKPPLFEFCIDAASQAEAFILLVGNTYPERGTAPDGKSISHAEYEAALGSALVRRVFVFLAHPCYQQDGLDADVEPPRLRELLRRIRDATERPGHLVVVLPDSTVAAAADCIHSYVDMTLRNDEVIIARVTRNQSVDRKLDAVVMSSRETDALELPGARERVAGANERARSAFRSRQVPEKPFDRLLYRRDDAGHKIFDFEARLESAVAGEVLGIVSPSGQGKSTFVASFPDRYRLASENYLFITGRELRRAQIERLFLDTALLAKTIANVLERWPQRRFFLFVDALNECDSSDSLLLDLIIWLEQLIFASAARSWPVTILLTMRPDVAKAVPELSRILVRPGNAYDMEPFGDAECRQAFERHRIATRHDSLSASMRSLLRDPLMLGIISVAYAGLPLPLEDGDLDLLGAYITRLAMRSRGGADEQILAWTKVFAAQLLLGGSQTLTTSQLDGLLDGDALGSLLSAGILTDEPEQSHLREDTKRIGFRYDRIAEYCMGRHVEAALTGALGDHDMERDAIDVMLTLLAATGESDLDTYAELHWSGLCLGLFFFVESDPTRRKEFLIAFMKHANPRWRMLARGVLIKLYAGGRQGERGAFQAIARFLAEYSNRNRRDREFRAEYLRMSFEVVAAEYREMLSAQRRTADFDLLIRPLCQGLVSSDQEIADQATTSLASLMALDELVPTLLRLLRQEFERLDMGLLSIVRKQITIRVSVTIRRWLRRVGGDQTVAVPLFSVVKLLIVCFASDLQPRGQEAAVLLLGTLLRRMKSGVAGRALGTAMGRYLAIFILSTLVEVALRSNKMPINAREWTALVRDPNQYEHFKRAVRLVNFQAGDFDVSKLVAMVSGPAANPFVYQILITALSSKFELAEAGSSDARLPTRIIETIRAMCEADRGDGVCKYVASLVLYQINTFGSRGNAETAKLMTELALDLLENHNGLVGTAGSYYNSNVIGTTGRSLITLAKRKVPLDEDAFMFVRAQIGKVTRDQNGAFTRYLIENLALLAILVPEDDRILKLIKDEILAAAMTSFTAPPVKDLRDWVLDAFVRIRATYPITVDRYLASSRDSALYHEVRRRHAEFNLKGDLQGLDSELVSWAFERVFFDLVTRAKEWSARVDSSWSDYLEASPRLKPAALVQLGFIILGEGFTWAEASLGRAPVGARVTSTP
jgi:hypothetical protein